MDNPIQKDWENRQFVSEVAKGIQSIAGFLNEFDLSTRYRLAKLNERVSSLERSLDYMETKVLKKVKN
eukprot:m.336395 g.336395  ORF g.336395 m.336395 type:complete len:68 (+) comp17839_c0_seq1:218-421(+)